MEIKNLLESIVASIVDDPAGIHITEEQGERGLVFSVSVSSGDVGKVIGKEGRIASAIRTVVKAAGMKQQRQLNVNILKDPFIAA